MSAIEGFGAVEDGIVVISGTKIKIVGLGVVVGDGVAVVCLFSNIVVHPDIHTNPISKITKNTYHH